jgi:glucose/arabinose dehydrogenase
MVRGVNHAISWMLLFVLLSVFLLPSSPQQVNATTNLKFNKLNQAGSYKQPIAVRHAKDGSKRLFVVEKTGRIYSLLPSGRSYRKQLFLDLTDRVNSKSSEQGLLGLAFHPKYKTTGLIYVNYTSKQNQTIISSFRANTSPSGIANRTTEKVLIRIAQPFDNHNGGDLAFGPDGYLYIATGDGGSYGDPQGNSQNLKNLLGKILRIDVRSTTVNGTVKPYQIPASNPFVKRTGGVRHEIYAYGLRNPWRISFDRVTGELWAADVGQNQLEEVNVIQAGGNYGWNVMEGTSCYSRQNEDIRNCNASKYKAPVFEYDHRTGGKSVTGGYVYRGTKIAALRGKYVLADFISGRMWTLQKQTNGKVVVAKLSQNIPLITSFGEDEQGELYFVTYDGALYRID